MSAFVSLAEFVTALKAPKYYYHAPIVQASGPTGIGFTSEWPSEGLVQGAVPGGNSAPTSATAGALGATIETGADLFIGEIEIETMRKDLRWALMLVDRLVHTDGLSGSAAGAQTTNLPTTPLTRATSGADVRAALEVYSAPSTGSFTFTTSYTNQAGASGHTSDAAVCFSAGQQTTSVAGAFIPIPLASTDTGLRSVESLTLSGTGATAGNFGITLYRPLCMVFGFGDANGGKGQWCPLLGPSACSLPKIDSNACLMWIACQMSNGLGTSTAVDTSFRLVRR